MTHPAPISFLQKADRDGRKCKDVTQRAAHALRRHIRRFAAALWLASSLVWSQDVPSNQLGTAFVVAEPGYLLTAFHTIKGETEFFVGAMETKKLVKAELIASDESADLALLKANISASPLKIAAWPSVPVGLDVFVIGFPQPNMLGYSKKITQGIINGTRGHQDAKYFQLSAEVQRGNSGGPAIAPDGSVVGVVVRKLNALSVAEKTKDLPQNVNYALNASIVAAFLERAGVRADLTQVDLSRNRRAFDIFRDYGGSVFLVIARNRVTKEKQAANETPPIP